ncbi:alpha/beta hydrolase [Nocardia sp. NPDC004568]|uniref:alpha/beta hydrolase n=1 Tax=Nocardia sp. NPDC004568 TaxID=3154551 RepID=UPI0033B1AD46
MDRHDVEVTGPDRLLAPEMLAEFRRYAATWLDVERTVAGDDITARRTIFDAVAARISGPTPHVATVRRTAVELDGRAVELRWYVDVDRPAGTVVFFHGGGWVQGSIDSHDTLCRHLAVDSAWQIVSVGYSLAPENPYPAALDEGLAVLDAVRARADALGDVGTLIAVAGDSAGGNLALAVALADRDRGSGVDAIALAYPVCSDDFDRSSYREFAEGFGLDRNTMMAFWDAYAPGSTRSQGYVSFLDADLRELGPVFIQSARIDVLSDEVEALAKRLTAQGNPVTYHAEPGVIHGYLRYVHSVPQARDAVRRFTQWLTEVTLGRPLSEESRSRGNPT